MGSITHNVGRITSLVFLVGKDMAHVFVRKYFVYPGIPIKFQFHRVMAQLTVIFMSLCHDI